MQAPCGMLMVQGDLRPEAVAAALNDQGGPPWDETVYQMVTGVDLASLVRGEPVAGEGTAVSVASSGWWLRSLDDLADRLALQVGFPVLAAFESSSAAASAPRTTRAQPPLSHRQTPTPIHCTRDALRAKVARRRRLSSRKHCSQKMTAGKSAPSPGQLRTAASSGGCSSTRGASPATAMLRAASVGLPTSAVAGTE